MITNQAAFEQSKLGSIPDVIAHSFCRWQAVVSHSYMSKNMPWVHAFSVNISLEHENNPLEHENNQMTRER